MGKPTPAPAYRDEDAVSMHTTRGDYEYDDVPQIADQPPTYTDSVNGEGSAALPPNSFPTPGSNVPNVADDYAVIERNGRAYAFGKPINQHAITIRMDERLTDPDNLYKYVTDYLRLLPPRPVVQIHGYHTQTVRRGDKREKKQVVDFDVLLSLQHFLGKPLDPTWWDARTVENGEPALRGGFRKTRAKGYQRELEVGETKPDLQEWCKEYCASPSKLKIFRVSRTISGLDEALIRQRIEALIRSTNYRGHILISFPLEDRAVDIYSPHAVNRWRTTTWIRWFFYLTFLWLFTWPLLYFLTRRWSVYTVNWAFSLGPAPNDPHGRKRYATLSEEQWFAKHRHLIKRLVLDGHQGDASQFDLEDELEDGRNARFESGNAHVNQAVGLVQAGLAGWNAVQRGLGGDPDGWGGDC
ncbi:hypothetical protein BFW01_g2882 [Lasiodiplodia theobromae]|uniref:Uncharacterized protein n=1 Tax=Lasiodiplodia theobromae TaxID=45133 RepID=A0A5N5DFG5_9PEZI|nr:ABC transporter protein [Lasiodiplodia theobromae]KAB2576593.1 hypothetical protein DBV05_g4854 [Lasiodiplodia theobromae]KAF4546608.1 ABC transporter protein [Lasiodiplodia theobromae]KAF9632020.1 hypothetical protein BFW01_g2882 [Lasiodiplodia theobromae]